MSSEIEIPPVLTLAEGLVGLPLTKVLHVTPFADGAFVELQDADEPALGWFAASAEDVRPGMTDELRRIGRITADEVLLVLLGGHGDPPVFTANLAGPVAVAPDGAARQLVLEGAAYELRAHLGRLAPSPANG
ncbi:MAG: hypothetical protein U0838_05915 [Chloroflexota bacterium]